MKELFFIVVGLEFFLDQFFNMCPNIISRDIRHFYVLSSAGSLRIGLQVFQGKTAYGIDHRFQHIVRILTFGQTAKVIDPPS